MADQNTPAATEQQNKDAPSQYVKVRAKVQRGIIRAGIHWPATETFEQVSQNQLEQLKAEPMLEVKEISEGEVPADKKRTPAKPMTPEEDAAQKAELLKSAEFPNRGVSGARGPVAPTTSVPVTPKGPGAVDAEAATQPAPTGVAAPQGEDHPGSDKVIASGYSDDTQSRRRR
jgi:Mu-like prophage FluMu N-terminal domain